MQILMCQIALHKLKVQIREKRAYAIIYIWCVALDCESVTFPKRNLISVECGFCDEIGKCDETWLNGKIWPDLCVYVCVCKCTWNYCASNEIYIIPRIDLYSQPGYGVSYMLIHMWVSVNVTSASIPTLKSKPFLSLLSLTLFHLLFNIYPAPALLLCGIVS